MGIQQILWLGKIGKGVSAGQRVNKSSLIASHARHDTLESSQKSGLPYGFSGKYSTSTHPLALFGKKPQRKGEVSERVRESNGGGRKMKMKFINPHANRAISHRLPLSWGRGGRERGNQNYGSRSEFS